jgi:UDP-glucose 4-epimerase
MQVAVTGGAGFIGANLTHDLLATGAADAIVVIDDLSTGSRKNLSNDERVIFVDGTILDQEMLTRVLKSADTIVHLAAVPSVPRSLDDPLRSHHANATGTLHVLEAARRTGAHVIAASSSSVYGSNPALPKREDLATRPRSPYAASKLATEGYTLAYGASFDLDVLAFRFFNVYGPLQAANHAYAAVIPAFIAAALADMPLVVHGDGKQTRDFTFVGSVTRVLVEAVARRVVSDEPVNLAFGDRTSLLQVVSHLEEILGRPIARRHVASRAGDVRDSQADNAALRALFPSSKPVPLEVGLRHTVDWFSASGHA